MDHDFEAVLLDFDGTLFDTAPDLVGALNEVLAELALPPVALEAFRTMAGGGAMHLVRRAMTDGDGPPPDDAALAPHVERLIERYYARLTAETVPFAGVVETLETLAADGIRLGICTNKPAASTNALLAHFGLAHLFGAVHCGDEVPAKKPHADHLHGAASALGVPSARAVMVGDTATDINAARAADMPVVAVAYGYSPTPAATLGADIVIESFGGLPAALGSLSGRATGGV